MNLILILLRHSVIIKKNNLKGYKLIIYNDN